MTELGVRRPGARDMTRPGAHDKHSCMTGMCERQGLSVRRQRPKHTQDKVCVHGDNTLGTYTTGPGCSHDKDVHATKDFCRDMDSMSRHTCPVAKKKKKITPGNWGVTAWYQSLSIQIPRTRWAGV